MSMAVLLNGTLATDSQMLHNIGSPQEYTSQGQKLFVSPCKRAAFALVGAELDSVELSLLWAFLIPRLAAFYLSYDEGNPLELSADEGGLLSGVSAKGSDVYRRMFLVTQTNVWAIQRNYDAGGTSVKSIDPSKYWSEGSECNMANVYYKVGFDAVEIIRRLARITNTCGGEVQSVNLKDLTAFDRVVPPVKKLRKPRNGVKA